MFNSTEELTRIINNDSIQTIGDIATCVTGFYSGDDKSYLHPIDNSVKTARSTQLCLWRIYVLLHCLKMKSGLA